MSISFFSVVAIIVAVSILGVLARIFKQPLVLAYILTGVFIGASGLLGILNKDQLLAFSDLGVMFLLFLIGLEINYTTLKSVGRISLILGLGQIIITSLFGFLIARVLNFDVLPSLYLAIALTFSSTIIILKLLSERRDTNSLYGRISIGMLLVQDLVAIFILLAITGMLDGGSFSWMVLVLTFLKGIFISSAIIFLGRTFLPHIFDFAARSQELLFLISLGWVFLAVAVVERLGFSIEIGGFLAGLALANSAERFEIAAKVKPLRDFFIILFFVLLGASVSFSGFYAVILPALLFSLFVLIGNPLIVLILMGILGHRKRTSFLTGLTVAQISEFSLILASLGFRAGHIDGEAVALITAVGAITITASTYLILNADFFYKKLSRVLSVFERKEPVERGVMPGGRTFPYILIGAHRVGQSVLHGLPKDEVLVVDFDPEVVAGLKKHGFRAILADLADPDFQEIAPLKEARLIVSTSPDLSDNLMLLSQVRLLAKRPKIVARAEDELEARILYDAGADYVLFPQFTAGQYLGKTMAIDPQMSLLPHLREKDLILMKKIAKKMRV